MGAAFLVEVQYPLLSIVFFEGKCFTASRSSHCGKMERRKSIPSLTPPRARNWSVAGRAGPGLFCCLPSFGRCVRKHRGCLPYAEQRVNKHSFRQPRRTVNKVLRGNPLHLLQFISNELNEENKKCILWSISSLLLQIPLKRFLKSATSEYKWERASPRTHTHRLFNFTRYCVLQAVIITLTYVLMCVISLVLIHCLILMLWKWGETAGTDSLEPVYLWDLDPTAPIDINKKKVRDGGTSVQDV